MKVDRRFCAMASLAVIAAATAGPALAQQPPSQTAPPAATAQGTQTFDAAFFRTYNPVSAFDMVSRTPGFEIRDGDDRRGFGATAGNVLINGERPSSKTTVTEQLKRIPADNVLRVELIAGSATAEASGQSQLVNVVLRQAGGGATTYVLALRHIGYSGRIGYTAQASRTLALGNSAELALDLQFPNLLGRSESYDILTNAAGVVTGSRIQNGQPKNRGVQGAANLKWRPTALDTVNVNLQGAPTWNQTEIYSLEVSPTGALRSELRGLSEFDNNYNAELGADWEHRFSPAFSTKLIGLVTVASVDQTDTFNILSAPSTRSTRIQTRATDAGERVARITNTWKPVENHTVEFGGEGAFNFRDTDLDIVAGLTGGTLVPVPLAVSKARVEETRGEAFVSDIWSVSDALTLEAGFTFEASRITQTGDQQKEREFTYSKPRFAATWTPDPLNTVRLSLLKDVSQLDFGEFSSTVDFVNASQTQGNPDLKPQQAWKARLEWQRRFSNRGAFTIAAFHDEVEDVHDLVDIGGFDAFGNIGDGKRTGIEIRAAAPLDAIGLPRAELRFNGLYQETEVTDPKTGLKRSFSISPERQNSAPSTATLNAGDKDWAYVITFRQELPGIQSSWGSALTQWAGRAEYKRAEIITYDRSEPRFDLFFETTAVKPVTIRFSVNNILSPSERRIRTFYQGDRSSGVISRVEKRLADGGPDGTLSYGVQVSGRF